MQNNVSPKEKLLNENLQFNKILCKGFKNSPNKN